MRLFRRSGFTTFDFGGYAESASATAGIAAFKQQFGGVLVEEYDGVVPVTRRGRSVLLAGELTRSLRMARA
jgi:lipid II:glycine glycyltransferase (peptidoglycan interpeptide bridge formation enzyme)